MGADSLTRLRERTCTGALPGDPADLDVDGNFSGTRLLGGHHHGDLIVTALVRGACRDMPTDHRMVRSTLDPEYGGGVSDGYEDTGDLHDYTGRYKPLPDSTQDPAPTSPAGATPRGGIDD